jgi:hypothetical protein
VKKRRGPLTLDTTNQGMRDAHRAPQDSRIIADDIDDAQRWAVDNGAWPDIAPRSREVAAALGIDLEDTPKPPE